MVTTDHMYALNNNASSHAHTMVLTVLDLGTGFRMTFPANTRKANQVEIALKRFKGRSKIHAMYFDRAPVLEDACNRLAIPVDTGRTAQ